ncbi:hypothetical protein CV102_25155 [Natronococcus pandeyae]|uniref:Uncharacterized protein n=1 Tax=Natronococcus pandeyae TaxID=2055836 RepID=A0A8J8TPN5_9EURY|nr:hypothetical protein [Natronococcus pandeyae]TYL35904.1 hypothetical protein CV102_25155 [Natronococcus pandeyae]
MSLTVDPRPPLPKWITDAYTVLSAHITDSGTDDSGGQAPAISRERAIDVLIESDELALEQRTPNTRSQRLIERGYLYEVNTELRVTTLSE